MNCFTCCMYIKARSYCLCWRKVVKAPVKCLYTSKEMKEKP